MNEKTRRGNLYSAAAHKGITRSKVDDLISMFGIAAAEAVVAQVNGSRKDTGISQKDILSWKVQLAQNRALMDETWKLLDSLNKPVDDLQSAMFPGLFKDCQPLPRVKSIDELFPGLFKSRREPVPDNTDAIRKMMPTLFKN